MSLHQLIYVSKATQEMSQSELVEILNIAKKNNASIDVTGSLFYNGGWFLQVLEGELNTLKKLYAKISLDKRHSSAKEIYCEPAERRTFGQWTMSMTNLEENTDDKTGELVALIKEAQNDEFSAGRSPAIRLLALFGQ